MAPQQFFELCELSVRHPVARRMDADFAHRLGQCCAQWADLVEDYLGAFVVHVELASGDHRLVTRNRTLIFLISLRPCDTFNCALAILELERCIALAGLVVFKLKRMDYTRQPNLAAVGCGGEIGGG